MVLSVVIGSFTNVVYAQSNSQNTTSLGNGYYIGGEVGAIDVSALAGSIATSNGTAMVNTFGGSASETYSTTIASARLYVGTSITSLLGAEMGYQATTPLTINYAGRTGAGVAWTGSQSFTVGLADVFATIHGDKDTILENIYLKAGLHYSTVSASTSVSAGGSTASVSSSSSGTGPALGVMWDKGLATNLDVRVSYTYYGNIAGQSGLNANLYNVGVIYKF